MNAAVLINSCDKYSFIWDAYRQIFFKYWGHCSFPIYFITNHKEGPIGQTIKVGDMSWSTGVKYALSQIREDHIIWTLEDTWFTEKVNEDLLKQLILFMTYSITAHIRLYVSEGSRKIERRPHTQDIDILNENEDYRASLNPSIWRRNVFMKLLDNNKNIWESETIMTEKSREFLFCTVKEMRYLVYNIEQNMIEQGKVTRWGFDYLERNGINISKYKDSLPRFN